jgi:hypothetical protein
MSSWCGENKRKCQLIETKWWKIMINKYTKFRNFFNNVKYTKIFLTEKVTPAINRDSVCDVD